MIFFTLAYLLLEKFILLLISHVCDVFLDSLFLLRPLILSVFRHFADIVNAFGIFAQNAFFETIWITTQQDIGTTTSHVGSNGYSTATPRLGYNLRLTLVIFRIEDIVRNTLQIEHMRENLRDLNGGGTHQHWLTFLIKLFDLLDNGPELRLLTTVNHIWQVLTNHRLVGLNCNYIQCLRFM